MTTVRRRYAAVTLGGGPNDTVQGVRIEQLRIDFEVVKYFSGATDIATIKIYNLSPERRALLRERYRRVILEFGYAGTGAILFVGQVYNIVNSRDSGVNIVTTLYCGSGLNLKEQGAAHMRFPVGTAFSEMVDAVAELAKSYGISFGAVDPEINDVMPGAVRGRVVSGSFDDTMRELLDGSGYTYSINDEVLTIEKPTVAPRSNVIISPATGLIGSLRETNAGLDFTCSCTTAIEAGKTVGAFSEFSETGRDGLNYERYESTRGAYVQVMQLTHKGNNYSGGATTDVVGLREP